MAVFTHGQELLTPEHPDSDEVLGYRSNFCGADALPWEDVMLLRTRPTWTVGYAFTRDELLAARGVEPEVEPSDDLPGWSGQGCEQ